MNGSGTMDAIRIFEAYERMGAEMESRRNVSGCRPPSRIRRASHLKECGREGDPRYRIREYPVLAEENDEKCGFVVTECESGDVLFNSCIDDDPECLASSLCGRCGRSLYDQWGSPDGLCRRVSDIARKCRPGASEILFVTDDVPVRITRLRTGFAQRCREPLCFEANEGKKLGDMSDEEFAAYWKALTPEQRDAMIEKIPPNVIAEFNAKQGRDLALKNGAQSALLSYILMGGPLKKKVAKAGGKAAAKAGGKALAKVAGKQAAKTVGKEAAKIGTKALVKSGLKKIPVVGALVGAGLGAARLWGRDENGNLNIGKLSNWGKAAGELGSGIASCCPGAGTAISAAIDGGLAAWDTADAIADAKNAEQQGDGDADGTDGQEGQEGEAVTKEVAENEDDRQDFRKDDGDSEYPIPCDELHRTDTYAKARSVIYNAVRPLAKGLFSDEDWSGVYRIFDRMRELGVNLNTGVRNDGRFRHGYLENESGNPCAKAYEFEAMFTNVAGKRMCVKGQVLASGAGTVEFPLGKYDVAVQMY